jgi:hypothetical protein
LSYGAGKFHFTVWSPLPAVPNARESTPLYPGDRLQGAATEYAWRGFGSAATGQLPPILMLNT